MATGSEETEAADAGSGVADAYPARAADRAGALAAQFDAWLALTGTSTAAMAGPVRLPMLSGSMHPALPRGCTLVIEPASAAAAAPGDGPSVGDVVIFARDGKLVAHRVLRVARRGGRVRLLEMGDANRRGAWRPLEEVAGRVIGAEGPDGRPLPPPASRWRALRALLRHWLADGADAGTDEDVS